MAKGDHKRNQDQLKAQWSISQGSQNKLTDNLYNSNAQFGNNYDEAAGRNFGDYDNIMGGYQQLFNSGMSGSAGGSSGGGIGANSYGGYQNLANGKYASWDPLFRGAFDKAIGGFGNFADTGGFSDQDKQDIRARAIAPTRAVYANAQNNLNRSRALGGGSPNYGAAQAKMARDLAYGISDMNVNANASLAEMIQQGKLAGLSGLTQAGSAGQGLSTNIDSLNLQANLAGLQGMTGIDSARSAASRASAGQSTAAQMAALSGMTNLYGTTPGLMNMTGNHLLGSEQNLLASQGLQNQFSNSMMQNQFNSAQVPGNFQNAMSNIGSGLNIGSQIVGGFAGLGGPGGSPMFGGGGYGGNIDARAGVTGMRPWSR